jgi:DNA-binding response OmpR family regulator
MILKRGKVLMTTSTIRATGGRYYVNDTEVILTAQEGKLVTLLLNAHGDIVGPDVILKAIWGLEWYDNYSDKRMILSLVHRANYKLGRHIALRRGVGYYIGKQTGRVCDLTLHQTVYNR